jgi:hypothetical protein
MYTSCLNCSMICATKGHKLICIRTCAARPTTNSLVCLSLVWDHTLLLYDFEEPSGDFHSAATAPAATLTDVYGTYGVASAAGYGLHSIAHPRAVLMTDVQRRRLVPILSSRYPYYALSLNVQSPSSHYYPLAPIQVLYLTSWGWVVGGSHLGKQIRTN